MLPLSPASDTAIPQRYSSKTLDLKIANKTALQESLGWPKEPKRPLLCLPAGMTDPLGGELLRDVLPGILTLPVELLILGRGSAAYGKLFTELAKEEPHRIHIVPEKDPAIRVMYAASDMALFFADSADLPELANALHYGVVPVGPSCAVLENYDPVQEAGNSFSFEPIGPWQCYAALVRALETYKFPFDWRTIQRHCMETLR